MKHKKNINVHYYPGDLVQSVTLLNPDAPLDCKDEMLKEKKQAHTIDFLAVAGGLFALVGSFGLLKLPTLMMRLHGPTKATTLGLGSVLVASMLYAFAYGEGSLHELLVMAFIFVTAPISASNWHMRIVAAVSPDSRTIPGTRSPARSGS